MIQYTHIQLHAHKHTHHLSSHLSEPVPQPPVVHLKEQINSLCSVTVFPIVSFMLRVGDKGTLPKHQHQWMFIIIIIIYCYYVLSINLHVKTTGAL